MSLDIKPATVKNYVYVANQSFNYAKYKQLELNKIKHLNFEFSSLILLISGNCAQNSLGFISFECFLYLNYDPTKTRHLQCPNI